MVSCTWCDFLSTKFLMLTSLSDLTIVCFAYEYIPVLSCLNSFKFDLTWLTLIVCFDKLTTKKIALKNWAQEKYMIISTFVRNILAMK